MATSPPSRCGPRGRRAPSPVRPASSATTSRWPPSPRSTSWSHRCARAGRCSPSGSRCPRAAGRCSRPWSGRSATSRGSEHEDVRPPDVPDPDDLPSGGVGARRATGPGVPFWGNFDQRMLEPSAAWPPPGPLPPTWRTWVRCRPTATFDDLWVDAARSLIVLDVGSWPAGSRPHALPRAALHRAEPGLLRLLPVAGRSSEWLLLDTHSPVAQGGLLSWTGRVWSRRRQLVASGGGQAVFRHT